MTEWEPVEGAAPYDPEARHARPVTVGGELKPGMPPILVTPSGGRPREKGPDVIDYSPAAEFLSDTGLSPDRYNTFRSHLARRESGSYAEPPNEGGYMGRYQMGKEEIRESARRLGIPEPTQKQFLDTPALQERLFENYTLDHHRQLMANPRYANATPERRAAILAGAHLGGVGGVTGYLEGKRDPADSNGTHVSSYVQSMGAAMGGGGWERASGRNWNVSPSAVAHEQGRRNSSVRWMSPDDYLAMVPEIETDADSQLKRRSLLTSLGKGADIDAIPSLEVKVDGQNLKVIGHDGRARAQAAIDAGVDLIPVAFHGIGDGTGKGEYEHIEGMRGAPRRFDFQPVPSVPRETSQATPPASLAERRKELFASDKASLNPLNWLIGSAQAAEKPMWTPVEGAAPYNPSGAAGGVGYAPVEGAAAYGGAPNAPIPRAPFISRDAAGRIIGAMGTGAARGFGDQPIGPTPETAAAVRGVAGPVGEAAYRAVEPYVETIGRGFGAGLGALAGAGEQIGREFGMSGADPARLGRDIYGLGEAALNVTGALPYAPRIPRNALASPAESADVSMVRAMRERAAATAPEQGMTRPERQAREAVAGAFAEDTRGGGPTAERAMEQLAAAREEGQPLTLADVGGRGLKRLAGAVYREGGAAGTAIRDFLESRGKALIDYADTAAGARIGDAINRFVATGSMRQTAKDLAEARSTRARPVWEAAMDGGLLPPVERTLARDYGKASREADKATAEAEKARSRLEVLEKRAREQNVQVPAAPVRLSTFLIRNGGLRDVGGDLKEILGGERSHLINQTGQNLDDAALAAWEAGYLPHVPDRPTVNDLLDAVAQDHNRAPIYSELDRVQVAQREEALARNAATDQRRTDRPTPDRALVSPKRLQFERDKVADAKARVEAAAEERKELADLIKAGQEDGTAFAKGAVYSPYLGRLLKNPRVVEGLNRGYRIERDLADGEGRQFRPKDFAVLREDAEGNPVVGAVPNMKLLATAKEGLDAKLESEAMHDPLTGRLNKEGRAVAILRDGLLTELDRLNPEYKAARDQWSGDTSSIRALRDGRDIFKTGREELVENWGKLTENEREFYKLGVADRMREDLENTRLSGDASKAIINSPSELKKLRTIFDNDASYRRFVDNVMRERQMFETAHDIMGGSQTAERAVPQGKNALAAMHAMSGLRHLVHGNPYGVIGLARAARDMSLPHGAFNLEVAKLLTDPNIALAAPGQTRSALGPFRGGSPGIDLLTRFPMQKVQNSLRMMGRPVPSPSMPMGQPMPPPPSPAGPPPGVPPV